MHIRVNKAVGLLTIGVASVVVFFDVSNILSVGQTDTLNTTSTPQASSQASPSQSSTGSATTYPSTSTGSSSGSSTGTESASISKTTSNWAGYVSTGGTYTAIAGSWTVPSVAVDDEASADATWIGIGGVNTDDLIQVGTEDVVSDGQANTASFYEELPNNSQTISNVNVSPGDTIEASIDETSTGEWNITIKDVTNGEAYSTTTAYDSSDSSAEWIEEAPSDTTSIIPLDNFGSVSFNNATTVENGATLSLTASGASAINMVNDEDEALTDTSAISSDDSSFSVSRTTASSDSDDQPTSAAMPDGWSRHEPGYSSYGSGSNAGSFGDSGSDFDN